MRGKKHVMELIYNGNSIPNHETLQYRGSSAFTRPSSSYLIISKGWSILMVPEARESHCALGLLIVAVLRPKRRSEVTGDSRLESS